MTEIYRDARPISLRPGNNEIRTFVTRRPPVGTNGAFAGVEAGARALRGGERASGSIR